jgi:hypothetical protein
MEGYVTESRRLDALYEAMQLVVEEFRDTKDADVASAGHVIAELFIKRIKAMEQEMDKQADAR